MIMKNMANFYDNNIKYTFDIKGSVYQRKSIKNDTEKLSPKVLKDTDFINK